MTRFSLTSDKQQAYLALCCSANAYNLYNCILYAGQCLGMAWHGMALQGMLVLLSCIPVS